MTNTFIERNKNKSSLAALLLLLRQRRLLSLLLLLVVGASTLFVTPSSFLVDLPGGTRMAAGMAWIASRAGFDVTRWGLAGGSRTVSFGELLAAFDSARGGRAGRAGWGPFFAPGDGKPASAGSLDYVKGSRADLAGGDSGGGVLKGVVDPAQASQDSADTAVGPNDVGGQREQFVKAAFAGGFFNGVVGGASDGANALSGGAYAGRGFFTGSAGAPSSGGSAAVNGLQNQPTLPTPAAKLSNGYAGRISSAFARSLQAKETQGAAGASVLGGGRAYTQLAQGNGQDVLVTTPNCSPGSNCPGEYAATNSGAIYDGNAVNNAGTNGIVTAPAVDGITSPSLPSASAATGAINSANQMSQDAATCQAADAQYDPQEDALNAQMQSLSQQFANAQCGSGGCSMSKVQYCQQLGNQMTSLCNQYAQVSCAHMSACPLTASSDGFTCSNSGGQYLQCQQGGNGVTNPNPIVINPNTGGNTNGQGASNQ